MRSVILLIYPPRLLADPTVINAMKREGLPSPVSIEHSLIDCERCTEQGWIGPKQLAVAKAGGGEVICFYCLMKDPQMLRASVIGLNSEIDQVPRRIDDRQ